MKLSQFKFNLPESLIAHSPSDIRDESRLMVLHRDSGKIEHKIFKDVLDYFDDKDVMILNNTKCSRRVCMVTKKKQVLPLRYFCCAN
jgi:S-adenosylmethionine:tRNA ribosyltransferase-isomerase